MYNAIISRGFVALTLVMLLIGCGLTPNPRDGSSTAPPVGDIVTDRYDVSALLLVLPAPNSVDGPDLSVPPATAPSLFSNANSYLLPSPSRAERIEGLENYIRDNVETESWKNQRCSISSESTDRRTTALLITNSPEVQRKVHALLERLRMMLGRQVSVEVRLVLFDDDEQLKLHELLQSRLAEVRNAGRYRRDVLLDGEELNQLNESLAAQMHGISMGHGPPRLTLFDGQRSALVLQTQQAYVADLKSTPDGDKSNRPGWHYEPVIQTITATGVVFNVVSGQSPDGKTVFVDLHGSFARLLELITERFVNGPAGVVGTIQRPVLSVFKIDAACAIPDNGVLLLGGTTEIKSGDPAFNATSPDRPATDAKIKELAEKDSHRHV